MNPIGALIIFATVAIVLFSGSRRLALLAIVAGSIYVTQGQGFLIGGFNVFSVRIFEIAGIFRVVTRKELPLRRLTRVDKAILALYIFTAVVYCLRASEHFANEIGVSLDGILAYFICRSLLGGIEDLRWFLRCFAMLLIPYVLLVLIERHQGQSPWTLMGGFSSSSGWSRNGVIRCTGSFRHPSLMGSLGASFLALYLAMLWSHTDKKTGYVGAILCLLLVAASNSGAPLNFAGVIIVGWIAWRFRTKVKWIFRGMLVLVVLLAIVMKAPVWFLLQRISDITGGDGWHRAELIDQAVRNFAQWWFAGMDLAKTTGWFATVLPNVESADICNQFVLFGLTAGIGAVALFVTLLLFVFKALGKAIALVRSRGRYPRYTEYYLWGLGVLLVGHISNWLGITYYDQFYMIWSLQLAAMVNLSEEIIGESATPPIGDPDPMQNNIGPDVDKNVDPVDVGNLNRAHVADT
jgi:hypothetical protein